MQHLSVAYTLSYRDEKAGTIHPSIKHHAATLYVITVRVNIRYWIGCNAVTLHPCDLHVKLANWKNVQLSKDITPATPF